MGSIGDAMRGGRRAAALRRAVVAATAVLALAASGLADGAVEDPTFGPSGTGSITLPHDVWSLSADAGGRLLAVGSTRNLPAAGFIGITRLRPSGVVDPSYGSGGTVVTRLGTGGLYAFDSAVDAQGRLLVSGLATPDAFVARFLETGAADASFGTGGIVRLPVVAGSSSSSAVRLALDGAQRIVVLLQDYAATGTRIARLTADGALDPSFDADGLVQAPTSADGGLVVADDGTITVAGLVGSSLFGIRRLTAAGAVDTTFGTNGIVDMPASTVVGISAIDLDPSGRVVVAGLVVPYDGSPAYVARFSAGGQLDATFGSGGFATVGSGFRMSWFPHAVEATAGGILLAGGRFDNADYDAFVAHLAPDGQVDTGFAAGGYVLAGRPGASARDGIVQSEGRYVIGAPLRSGDGYVGRFLPGDVPPAAPVVPAPGGGAAGGGESGGSGGGAGGGGGASPDLLLTQVADRVAVTVGDVLELRLRVTLENDTAASGATHLVLTDALPLLLEPVSVTTNRGSCVMARTVVCDLDFIASGLVAEVRIAARVTGAGEIVNTAAVKANETDPDPANNTATVRLSAGSPATAAAPVVPGTPRAARGVTRIGTGASETLRGTRYADVLDGRGGRDTILALAGNDTIRARDGARDVVVCGPGVDTITADAKDVLVGCEKVARR